MTFVAHGKSAPRLIVFGCGYVGSAVATAAQARGAEVTALTRNADAASRLQRSGIHVVVDELASDRWHDAIPGGAEYVLDCVSGGGAGVEGYRRSYLEGMQSILRWTGARGRAGTLVYTSSTSVYPQGGGAVVDENAAPLASPDPSGTAAAASARVRADAAPAPATLEPRDILRETERVLAENAGACDRWFVLRLAGIYGPARHSLLDQVRAGSVAGVGDHHLNVAHRDDIVAAVLACFGADASVANQAFNVADDAPARKREVVEWLAARLGVSSPPFTGAPAGGRRAITPDRIIANAKLKSVLGWWPRYPSFREGYEQILATASG